MAFTSLEQKEVQVVLKLYKLINLADPGTELSASTGNLLYIHAHWSHIGLPGEEVLSPDTCVFDEPSREYDPFPAEVQALLCLPVVSRDGSATVSGAHSSLL